MTSWNSLNFVKRTAGLMGVLAASAAVALPGAAQMKPQTESRPAPLTTPGAPTTPELTAPNVSPVPGATVPGTTVPGTTVPGATVPGTTVPGTPDARPLVPNAATPAPTTPEAAAPASPNVAATSGNIVEIASASQSFKTLVAALNEAELAQVLEGTGPFTVFAPTDAAFEALPAGTVEELLKPENRATLVQILKYHVVSGDYPSAALQSGQMPTAAGVPLTVTVANGAVKVDGANVIQPDITASNGVIHAIDQVILPAQPQQTQQPQR
jgi:uncharacterized surface protein with fasciclin (FAS1) repeats